MIPPSDGRRSMYRSNGTRTVSLRVTDSGGLSDVVTLPVVVGNTAPVPLIDTPLATLRWRVGQSITFSGRASDAQQGSLPAAGLAWTLVMNHCQTLSSCHEHPIQTVTGVRSGSFVAPDHAYPSYLTLRLTVRDSGGLEATATRRIDPQTVTLRLESSPAGLELGFGNDVVVAPAQRTVIVGSAVSISAPSPQTAGGRRYAFSRWSNGGAQTQIVVAPAVPTTYTATFTDASGSLPPAWSTDRVGSTGTPGSASHASGRFDVQAYGEDVWATSDAFQFTHRSWTGDGEIVARVSAVSLPTGAAFAMAGVMFRESTAPNARHAAVLLGTNGKLKFRRRPVVGGDTFSDGPPAGTLSVPQWVKLTRRGNVFAGYYSRDGRSWAQSGPSLTLSLPATISLGLVALRSGSSEPTLVRFDAVDLSSSPLLPADVGSVGAAGSSTRDGGTRVLLGGGTDVWATSDAFHYEYRMLSGDGDITVRLEAVTAPVGANWAMAGIMFRDSLSAGARHAALLLSTDGKLKFRRRSTDGGYTVSDGPSAGSTVAPRWLRLTRRGNSFAAYHSVDGVQWTPVHVPQAVTLAQAAYAGIWVLRNEGSGFGQARFSNVRIGPPGQ